MQFQDYPPEIQQQIKNINLSPEAQVRTVFAATRAVYEFSRHHFFELLRELPREQDHFQAFIEIGMRMHVWLKSLNLLDSPKHLNACVRAIARNYLSVYHSECVYLGYDCRRL